MNKLFTKIASLSIGLALAIGVGVAVGSGEQNAKSVSASTISSGTTTYTFTSKTWTATGGAGNWTSGKNGSGFSNEGIQVTTTDTGANGTSPDTFQNVSQVVLTYHTNKSKGAGTAVVKIGSNSEVSKNWSKPSSGDGTTTDQTITYDFSPKQSGTIKITLNTTTNSIYLMSCAVTCVSGAQKLDTPSPAYNDNTKKVSWDPITGASSYQVKVDSGSYETATSPYDVRDLSTGVSHTICVIAKGDGTNYTDSDIGQTSFTPTTPAVYTNVTVTGGSVQNTDVGSAYIQCNASATGTNIPDSPTFTWYVTETNSYATTTSVAGKASIDTTGKVTFTDSCTVYVWALAPDETTHNTSGYAAVSGNLKGSATNPYSVTEAWNIADGLGGTGSNIVNNGLVVFVTGIISTETASIETKTNGATFDITDNTKTLKAYSISGAQATDSEASGYVAKDYTVVVGGAIIDYKGTYEVGYASGYNSSLYSSTAPAVPEITALALDTSNVTKQFDLNSEFNYTGLVVTATVDGNSGVPISSDDYSVSSPDMTTQGEKTVTVTYTGSEYDHESTISTSYNINVVIPSPDETIELIDAIGTVAYTQASYDKIAAARSSYDALPAESKALVTNYSDLEDAESDFEDLELAAVDNVETLITNIGTVTLSSGTAITTAETAYAALLDGNLGKSLVNNHSTLTSARETYDALVEDRAAADAVEALIDALPAASSITDYTHHSDIVAARTAYNALSNSAKGIVDSVKLQKLVDCETADAQYAPFAIGTYSKVTDLSQLENGALVIITNSDGTTALSTEQKSNNRGQTNGSSSAGGTITIESDETDIQVFSIEGYSTEQSTIVAFNCFNGSTEGYIYAASSTSNYLRTESSVSNNSKFLVTLNDGTFSLTAQGTNTRNALFHNFGNSLFSCYASKPSGGDNVAIYVKGSSTPTETYTITYDANGGSGETMSPTTGSEPVVAACTYTAPTGKEFLKWNDEQDGTGNDYPVGSTVTSDVTLYAIWGTPVAPSSDYFTKITSTSEITDGKYVIAYGNLIFDGSLEALDKASNTVEMSLANLLTSYFTITDGHVKSASGYFIGNDSDSNALSTSTTTEYANTVSIDDDGNLVVKSSGGAYLRYNKTSGQERFRYYKSSSYTGQQAIELYKVNLSKVILDYVTCNDKGTSQPTGTAWSTLKNYYNTLSTTDKSDLEEVVASEAPAATDDQKAMAKYDYIVGKYYYGQGIETYEDFIGRNPSPIGSHKNVLGIIANGSGSATIIVVVISAISAASIGGYFLFRKKKED